MRLVGHGGDTQWFPLLPRRRPVAQPDVLRQLRCPRRQRGPDARSRPRSTTSSSRGNPRARSRRKASPRARRRYAGTYAFWRSNFSTIEKALGLTSVVKVAPTPDDTLLVSLAGNAKQYVGGREESVPRAGPEHRAHQRHQPAAAWRSRRTTAGEITGFVMDGLPFMSLRKLPLVATPSFNFTLLGLLHAGIPGRRGRSLVPARRNPRCVRPRTGPRSMPRLWRAAPPTCSCVIMAAIVHHRSSRTSCSAGIPVLFKVWLVLPIIAVDRGSSTCCTAPFLGWRQRPARRHLGPSAPHDGRRCARCSRAGSTTTGTYSASSTAEGTRLAWRTERRPGASCSRPWQRQPSRRRLSTSAVTGCLLRARRPTAHERFRSSIRRSSSTCCRCST